MHRAAFNLALGVALGCSTPPGAEAPAQRPSAMVISVVPEASTTSAIATAADAGRDPPPTAIATPPNVDRITAAKAEELLFLDAAEKEPGVLACRREQDEDARIRCLLAARYAARLPAGLPYVGLATPDGQYTVGMDAAAMAHPQTLLAYEMQGAPLRPENGAPLRLATPLKYGVKSLKRVGTVRFMAERPRDFWAERGYDWFIGH